MKLFKKLNQHGAAHIAAIAIIIVGLAAVGTFLLVKSHADTVYYCNSGDTLSGTTCTHTTYYAATKHYTCPSGGTLSGSTCYVYRLRTGLSCPSGYTVSSSGQCVHTYAATISYYSCNSGDTRSGTTCIHKSYYTAYSYTTTTATTTATT